MSLFLTIDERGNIFLGKDLNTEEKSVTNLETCQEALKNLNLSENFQLTTEINNEIYIVESFDFPLLVSKVSMEESSKIILTAQYGVSFLADTLRWTTNDFDQFCGLTTTGVPFRLIETAQAQLFELSDDYDDDSFTLNGKKIPTPYYFNSQPEISKNEFWTDQYQKSDRPNWDLNEAANSFKDMLPRLKLPKSRVLVLGCGLGHDAALFAQAGHVVTAVDFSELAIQKAKEKYGLFQNLQFIVADVFNLPQEWNESFDLVVEHTLFCAIDPHRRKELISVWKKLLHEEGHIFSVFFTMFKPSGPPFGLTEMDLRTFLKPSFQFLFWGRFRNSIPGRQGKELFVYAKKR